MPIYEYRCTTCNNLFEEWAKTFDSPEHEPCPKCGGDAERVISRTSFVLEGSGWYVTEYGNRKSDHESGAGAPGVGETPHEATAAEPKSAGDASDAAASGADSTPAAKEASSTPSTQSKTEGAACASAAGTAKAAPASATA